VLIAGAWIIKLFVDLHASKRQSRRDFLELWRGVDALDDMGLEVTVRHLIGTYLPAPIIRMVIQRGFSTQALFELAEIWSLVAFDPDNGTLKWKKPAYAEPASRGWLRFFLMGGYIAAALIAVLFLYLAVGIDPSKPTAWISALNTLIFVIIAWACLARFDTLGAIGKHGISLMWRLNRLSPAGPLATPGVSENRSA